MIAIRKYSPDTKICNACQSNRSGEPCDTSGATGPSGPWTLREPHKAISRENAKRMINMSEEIRQDRYDAVQARRLSVYMEDVVRRLERMQRGETEEEEKTRWLTKRKQQIWDNQYLKHHGHIACLLYTSPSPRDRQKSRMPSSA